MILVEGSTALVAWRVFWVPRGAARGGLHAGLLEGWEDLAAREDQVGVLAGDPVSLSPDYRVDVHLAAYGRSTGRNGFRSTTAETKRNYATDVCLLLTFLWRRARGWLETTRDLEDFEHWRRFADANPERIGGSKSDREAAAFTSLFRWAERNKLIEQNPVVMKEVVGRYGEVLQVRAAGRAKDARPSK
ncbi:hypothetical protein [Actinoallomurus oryzae]|uniref:hypothetical protein n=1 Tax=Actinoallomurus oryzae TaxID=502180 RepID=UPI0031E9B997